MTLQIDFWGLLLAIFALAGAMATVVWAFARIVIKTIDRRFETLDGDMRRLERANNENEKEMLRLREELAKDYVRREDWIRFSSVIDSKLDALWTKLDGLWAKLDVFREKKNGGE